MIKINHSNITINVRNLEVSIAFYRLIGLELQNQWGNHYAQLIAPGITIGLHPSEAVSNNSGNISIGFTTPDFEETRSFLSKCRIETTYRKEQGGEFLHLTDPDGTALYFICPKS